MIYHVTTKAEWEKALSIGKYEAPSLFTEGFIHMSQKDQVAGVLDRYYKGVSNLVLLYVDENFLSAELKYELSPSLNQEFPHLFGALNVEAVVNVVVL